MKVAGLEILRCDAGWRNYHFLKLTTDSGIAGWSEFDEGFGSPGVGAVIERLGSRVVGQDVFEHERIYAELYCLTRPAAGGVVGEGLGAIENAVLDAKAKALGVPCHALLGGKIRDRVRVYWSHCATWRINHPSFYQPAITSLEGVRAIGGEARAKGFSALKTNVFLYEGGRPCGWRPGFGVPLLPELNVDKSVAQSVRPSRSDPRRRRPRYGSAARPQLQRQDRGLSEDPAGNRRFRHVLGRDRQLHGARTGAYSAPQPAPDQLVRNACRIAGIPAVFPRAGGRRGDHRRGVERGVAVWQSVKIAAAADAFEVNIAPHNLYGHLATMMNVHFAAATPNLRIMEVDVDRLPWDRELFTAEPQFDRGHLVVPDTPGWGTEPNEETIRAHPPKAGAGMMSYRRQHQ